MIPATYSRYLLTLHNRQSALGESTKLEAALVVANIRRTFRKYDDDHNGLLEPHELQVALQECGVLPDGVNLDEFTQQMLSRFDGDGDGNLNVDEFVAMVQNLTSAGKWQQKLLQTGAQIVAAATRRPTYRRDPTCY